MRADPQADPEPSPSNAEPTSFELVFRAHYAGLCEFVAGYVRSRETAAELVQDLFLRLWELQGTPQSPPLTKAYLYTAARNRALRYLRHVRVEARWQDRAAREIEEPTASADDELRYREIAAAAEQAIAGLPERCRMVFCLSRKQHLSYAEIAEVLGITVSTVENQMWRALKSLRTKLAPYLLLAVGMTWR
jgi:RNA polymerase sigma-70 factor (ECF subfamily)